MSRTTPNPAASLDVLIVDDEANIRKTLALLLEAEGHTVAAVPGPEDALRQIESRRFDLVFLDIRLGTDSGIRLLPRLLEKAPWLKVIMITAFAAIDTAVEAMRLGAFDYIPKPFSLPQILGALKKVEAIQKLEHEIQDLKGQLQSVSEKRPASI